MRPASSFRWNLCCIFVFLGIASLRSGPALAHPALPDRIRELSGALSGHPDPAILLFERAELYRRHGHFGEARADYDEALRRRPDLHEVHVGRALLHGARDEWDEALDAVERYLARKPDDAEATIVRARILERLGRNAEAIAEITRALQRHPRPEPAHYLLRADWIASRGPSFVEEAIRGLDEGQARFGVLATLQLAAIERERERGRFDAALARLERLEPQYDRRESLLAIRGDLLLAMGRFLEAQAAYTEAWEAIAALPDATRASPATRKLTERLREAMRTPTTLADGNDHAERSGR